MKRAGNLVPIISDLNNLYSAYYKSSKHKKNKVEVVDYHLNLYQNLKELQIQILKGNIQVGNYHYFTIYDPKKRLICAAPFAERVLHHAIMNICHSYFEKYQISDSYATRIGKGTYKALKRAAHFNKQYRYYLKLDITKYFDSISHFKLKQQLSNLFKDKVLLILLEKIINSYQTVEGKGLPIGNLTSQYFANHFLAGFDHFVKEKLLIKPYLRYMDDMVIWSDNFDELMNYYKEISGYLTNKLNLNLKPVIINKTEHGLSFLSYRLFCTHIELQQKSKKRFLQKIRKYIFNFESGNWSQMHFVRHIEPLQSFVYHASSKGFRLKLNEEFRT